MSFKKIDCNLTQAFDEYPEFGVLSGVKVFVSGTAIAGPFAGCLMAEMGAKVLQSEAPKISCGTRGTTSWSQNHRNEFSITCNPRTPAGKKIFKKCLEWADIWIESSKAGTYAKMGLTDEVCWGVNSKLCIVHVSGYGQTGPYKSKASYDVSGQAMGGYMYMNGVSPTDVPLKVNPYLSDYVTAYNACMTALSAYIHALKTGKGESCDVAQYDTMFRLLDNYPANWFNKGYPKQGEPVPFRTGNKSDQAACFSFYDTKEGNAMFVAIVGQGPVTRGYPIIGMGKPGVTEGIPKNCTGFPLFDPRGKKADELCAKFCAEHTCDEIEEIFNKAGIPAMGITCTNPQVTNGVDCYFRICFLDPFQGTVLANYASSELKAKKAYCLGENGNEYDQGLVTFFKQAFEKAGGTVVTDSFPKDNSDFSSYLNKAKDQGCDVIFAPVSIAYSTQLVSQAASLNIGIPFLGSDTWDDNMVLQAAKGTSVQAFVSTFYAEGGNKTFDDGIKAYINGNADAKTTNGGDDTISAVTAMGYDVYYVALEALKAAGSTDPAKVMEALPGVVYDGVSGHIAFDETGDAIRDTAYIKTIDSATNAWKFVTQQKAS